MSTGEPDITVDCDASLANGPLPYGTNGWWTDQDADLWRARYAELAPQIVRLPLFHGFVEPVNDDDDPGHVRWDGFWFTKPIPWSGRSITYQRWFETLRDLDVTLMLYVPYLAGWLSANEDAGEISTYPPQSIAEYREFIQATLTFLVHSVGYPPEQIMLEPVNEPDLRCGQDPAVPCFWSNWSMEDLVAVVRAARQACDDVDPAIRLVGLSTCCSDELVDQLMQEYDGIALLNGLTYHRYIRGFDQSEAVELGQRIARWGLPVYLNEYGSPKYWSDGEEGALWHAAALAQIWTNDIVPVQFSMSEFPGMHEGYNRLGLFADWREDWQRKPAYDVYVGFSRHMRAAVPVSSTARFPLIVAAGRSGDGLVSVWVVNPDLEDQLGVTFHIRGLGADAAEVSVHAITVRGDPVATFAATGVPLTFAYELPARSIRLFVLELAGEVVESSYE